MFFPAHFKDLTWVEEIISANIGKKAAKGLLIGRLNDTVRIY